MSIIKKIIEYIPNIFGDDENDTEQEKDSDIDSIIFLGAIMFAFQ